MIGEKPNYFVIKKKINSKIKKIKKINKINKNFFNHKLIYLW